MYGKKIQYHLALHGKFVVIYGGVLDLANDVVFALQFAVWA